MEAEFDRLDEDKKGQLDVKVLMQSRLRVSHPVNLGIKPSVLLCSLSNTGPSIRSMLAGISSAVLGSRH
jgi:hypothetical protein